MEPGSNKKGLWDEAARNVEKNRKLAEARFQAGEDLQAKGLNRVDNIFNAKVSSM